MAAFRAGRLPAGQTSSGRGAAPWGWDGLPLLAADGLSRLVCLAAALFGLAVAVYSLGWFRPPGGGGAYWGLILLTEGAGMAVACADHLVLLLAAWGFMGVTLYLLAAMGGPGAADAAKKTMIMVGGADALLVLGAALMASRAGMGLHPASPLPLAGRAAWAAWRPLHGGPGLNRARFTARAPSTAS